MPPTPQGDSTNANAKQLIVDRIKQSTNILVAVSADPSVDSLSAALALTITLNKLDKHATAVFSGQVPPVMQFLNPEKTFENNVDSLRDFIISLDKEKADRLRYKLEKDVVRIFITPYRTTITEKDLDFSQGDFNVDLIIGLGVEKREDLDKTIVAHGRILHDAAVVTINANNQQSTLGSVDWHDPNSSSLCEMLVSLTEAMQKPGLLDAQIATALLTGIVAATDRFSNQHTTPKVMTMSAQLMAAGANQQLVATNMQKTDLPLPIKEDKAQDDGVVSDDGQLSIKHVEPPASPKNGSKTAKKEAADSPTQKAEDELDAALPKAAPPLDKSLDDLKSQLEDVAKTAEPKKEPPKPEESGHKFLTDGPSDRNETIIGQTNDDSGSDINASSWQGRQIEPPSHGDDATGTAAELQEKSQAEEAERNQKLLSHHRLEPIGQSDALPPIPPMPPGLEQPPTMAPAIEPPAPPTTSEPAVPEPPAADINSALQAVHQVYDSQPFDAANNPAKNIGSQDLSESTQAQPYIPLQPEVPSPPTQGTTIQPPTEVGGLPVIPPMPSLPVQEPGMSMPPMPPPLPPMPGEQAPDVNPNQPPADPGQFKIPGQ